MTDDLVHLRRRRRAVRRVERLVPLDRLDGARVEVVRHHAPHVFELARVPNRAQTRRGHALQDADIAKRRFLATKRRFLTVLSLRVVRVVVRTRRLFFLLHARRVLLVREVHLLDLLRAEQVRQNGRVPGRRAQVPFVPLVLGRALVARVLRRADLLELAQHGERDVAVHDLRLVVKHVVELRQDARLALLQHREPLGGLDRGLARRRHEHDRLFRPGGAEDTARKRLETSEGGSGDPRGGRSDEPRCVDGGAAAAAEGGVVARGPRRSREEGVADGERASHNAGRTRRCREREGGGPGGYARLGV